MDKSKINQTQLDFSSGLGLANLNLKTGRLLFECPGLTIGGGNYQISTSLIYNSKYKKEDFGNIKYNPLEERPEEIFTVLKL